MKFSGTRYPHSETMHALGISRDVGFLFDGCSLGTFMSIQMEGYKEETCQFLASLNVNFYDNEHEAVEDGQKPDEFGFITFEVHGQGYILRMSQIDTLFNFPAGNGTNRNFDKGELDDRSRIQIQNRRKGGKGA